MIKETLRESKIYTLTTFVEFSSAHVLHGHEGPCKRMHGHNWKVEVEVSGDKLDNVGMVIDFKEIRNMTNEVVDKLDHRFLNDLSISRIAFQALTIQIPMIF